MRLLLIAVTFLGAVSAFSPNGNIVSSKTRPQVSLNAFGVETVSALLSVDVGITPSQQPIIAGVVAALGLVGLALSSGNKSDAASPSSTTANAKVTSTPAAEVVDVSIPYNAAAMLEYTKLIGAKYEEATFRKFQTIYEEKAVAQVTAKKVARDCQMEAERLQSIIAKADAELAELVSK